MLVIPTLGFAIVGNIFSIRFEKPEYVKFHHDDFLFLSLLAYIISYDLFFYYTRRRPENVPVGSLKGSYGHKSLFSLPISCRCAYVRTFPIFSSHKRSVSGFSFRLGLMPPCGKMIRAGGKPMGSRWQNMKGSLLLF